MAEVAKFLKDVETILQSIETILKIIPSILDIICNLITDKKEIIDNIKQRLKTLDKVVRSIQGEKIHDADVRRALEELKSVLSSTERKLREYNEAGTWALLFKTNELNNMNQSLTDAFESLSAALLVYRAKKKEEWSCIIL